MNRDVVFQLTRCINNSVKIRSIMGMCKQVYDWKTHSIFRNIRRKSRGYAVDLLGPEKTELCEKIKANYETLKQGELSVLFGLLPYPGECEKNEEQRLVLNGVLDIMFRTISHSFHDLRKRVFGRNQAAAYDLLYWLFVFSTKYADTSVKEQIATVLGYFHSDTALPKEMKVILPLLANLIPYRTEQLSQQETRANYEKIRFLSFLSNNESNQRLMIESNIASAILPYAFKEEGAGYAFFTVCSTISAPHCSLLVDSPLLLPTLVAHMSHLLGLDRQALATWYNGIGRNGPNGLRYVLEGVAQCCAVFPEGHYLYDVYELVDVNTYAQQRCAAVGIPLLLLRLIVRVVPLAGSYMNFAREFCESLYVMTGGVLPADILLQLETVPVSVPVLQIEVGIDALIDRLGRRYTLPVDEYTVADYLLRLTGKCALGCILRAENMGKLMAKATAICKKGGYYEYHGACKLVLLLKRLCSYGNALQPTWSRLVGNPFCRKNIQSDTYSQTVGPTRPVGRVWGCVNIQAVREAEAEHEGREAHARRGVVQKVLDAHHVAGILRKLEKSLDSGRIYEHLKE